MMCTTISSFVCILFFSNCYGKSYKDHSLIHVLPSSDLEIDFFKELEGFYNVTFWKKPSTPNRSIEFSISRFNLAELIRDTKDMNIEFITVIRDLQSAFDNQTIKPYVRRKMDTFNWENYYSVEDIYSWLKDLSEMYPKEIQIQSFGRSVQDRHLLALKVKLEGPVNRPKVIIEGGCHAREWISPAFVTYMINTIVNARKSTDKELKTVAYAYEWIFIPLFNPDGYSYSQTSDRLWRKNYHGDYGVDLNRNFGIHFGTFGADKDNKNSEEHCGPFPFSEPESMALASFARENSNNLEYYIGFHSYGQYIIIPYTFETLHLDNYDEVKNVASKMGKRFQTKYKLHFNIGTAFETVGYKASGTSFDWMKKSLDVRYVVGIELPDQGHYGFALPPNRIIPTCEATMDSILEFLNPHKNDTEKLIEKQDAHNFNGYKHNKYGSLFFCYALSFFLYKLNIHD